MFDQPFKHPQSIYRGTAKANLRLSTNGFSHCTEHG